MPVVGKVGGGGGWTVWLGEPTHVHVTRPPTATVSTAGFWLPFRTLWKKMSPTFTEALVGTVVAVAWNVTGEPGRPVLVAAMGCGRPGGPGSTGVCAMPGASLRELRSSAVGPAPARRHAALTPEHPVSQ